MKGTISSIAFGGSGILRHDGLVVFVPFTAQGDTVTVELTSRKKNFATGKLLSLTHPSPSRITPRCPHFGTCGGCQLQHLDYPAQLDAKRSFILDTLQRIGNIPLQDLPLHPAKDQWHYRRHIRLTLRKSVTGFMAGYIGFDPAQFVLTQQCPIFLEPYNRLLETLVPFLSALSNQGIEEGSVRLIKTHTDKFLLAFHFSPTLPQNHTIAQQLLPQNPSWQGILMHSPREKRHWGDVSCQIEVLGLKAHFSPFGFVQIHPEQSEHLYRAILSTIDSTTTNILDLYCGIGITSLLFARAGKKVIGIESHPETLFLAKKNAALNHINNVQFLEGKAESHGVTILKKMRPDTVLCNPPRTGLDPVLLEALCAEKPHTLLYISCMPATLARDLKKLVLAGYTLQSIQGFDMFPQTTHVETLAVLST